jgi:hypothetical protein
MKKHIVQLGIVFVLVSVMQAANSQPSDNIKISKNECISRVNIDLEDIKKMPEKSSSMARLKELSSIYSHCAFYFQNKDIFYTYMGVSDNMGIMETHLKLHYEGVMPLKYREDKINVIKSLEKLTLLKSRA